MFQVTHDAGILCKPIGRCYHVNSLRLDASDLCGLEDQMDKHFANNPLQLKKFRGKSLFATKSWLVPWYATKKFEFPSMPLPSIPCQKTVSLVAKRPKCPSSSSFLLQPPHLPSYPKLLVVEMLEGGEQAPDLELIGGEEAGSRLLPSSRRRCRPPPNG